MFQRPSLLADWAAMAKRKKRRPREKPAMVDSDVDAEGNTLTLRQLLSAGTIAKLSEGPAMVASEPGGRLAPALGAALRAARGALGDRRPAAR